MLCLNVNVSHWLTDLNAWSPAGGTVLEGCGIFKKSWFVETDLWWWPVCIIGWFGLLPESFSASCLLT